MAWLRDSPLQFRVPVLSQLRKDLARLAGLHTSHREGEAWAKATRRTFNLLGGRSLLDAWDRPVPRGGAGLSLVMSDLVEPILEWQRKWNLKAPWLAVEALGVVMERADAWGWRRSPLFDALFDALKSFGAAFSGWPSFLGILEPIDPLGDCWNPLTENRTEARRRLMAKARKTIDGYLDRVEALARDRGVKSLPALDEHLRWLARWQVKGETEYWIAKTTRKARSTVHTALQTVAQFIDLPLREPNPPGRPRGTAD